MTPQDLLELKEVMVQSNNSLVEALKHISPSEGTKIFMENQKLINNGIEKELCELKTIVATKQDVILAVEEALKNFRKDCDALYAIKGDVYEKDGKPKFASFSTEKVLKYVGIVIGLGVLGVIGSIILSYFKI